MVDAQRNHVGQNTAHAQQMHTGLEPKEQQDQGCAGSGQQSRKKIEQFVYIIVGDYLVQYHPKDNAANVERVFSLLKSR